jgi:hypothetical protein
MGTLSTLKKASAAAIAQNSIEAHEGIQQLAEVLHRLKMRQHDLDHEYITRRAKLEHDALAEARDLTNEVETS